VHRNGDYKRWQQTKQILRINAFGGEEELGLQASGLEGIGTVLVGRHAQPGDVRRRAEPCCVGRHARPGSVGRRPRRRLVG
jgi:hypothetical protein